MEEDPPEEDTFKILIATDNHLGYGEKKPVLEKDSFKTFEEILKLAVQNDVDFVLLGGDLFHESQPSPYCMYKCSELLRRYCLGDRPVSIEFLSDSSINFKHLKNPIVNYEDPNVNISLPVFSIHGNHDNPAGTQQISALDIFSNSGLINYFGRWTDLSEVEIVPILLRKGNSHLALYGLSHIPDQRLARLFQEKKVKMETPSGDENWYNILVLHQNRANRGSKNYIPETFIPDFIDFVVWGHEHDCHTGTTSTKNNIFIYQPGSSVATSLSEGESIPKHVGLLKVFGGRSKLIPIPLKTVRPFIFDELILCNPNSEEYSLEDPKGQALEDVKRKLEEIIRLAQQRRTEGPALLPLIRLVVRYRNESQIFNTIRLGHEYENRVANPADMFKLVSHSIKHREKSKTTVGVDDDEFTNVEEWATRVEDVVERYFQSYQRGEDMKVLSVKLMTTAVSRYIDFGDNEAVKLAYDTQVKKTLEKLLEKNPDFKDVDTCLEDIKQTRLQDEDKEVTALIKDFDNVNRTVVRTAEVIDIDEDGDDVMDVTDWPVKTTRGRGRGSRGGRVAAPRRPRGTRGARAK